MTDNQPSRLRLAVVTGALLAGFVVLLDLAVGALAIPPDLNFFRTISPVYHHGFVPMASGATRWGARDYPFATNSLGLRDAAPRQVALRPSGGRIVLLGDSFVEGMAVSWEESFVGIVSRRLAPAGVEVLNAGAVSYSPRLYDLKIRELVGRQGLRLDELYVFIDISDPFDELLYEGFRPAPRGGWRERAYRVDRILRRHSFLWWAVRGSGEKRNPLMDAAAAFWLDSVGPQDLLVDPDFERNRATWTFDRRAMERGGSKGLALALGSMSRLADFCAASGVRLTIVVYPWPEQVVRRDLESLQVSFWRTFAATNRLGFIDLFPRFINERPAKEIIDSYFIPGDSHWNGAGHALVADALRDHLESGARRAEGVAIGAPGGAGKP